MNKIEITKVVGTHPVPSHGGPARPIYWQLRLNNEVLEEETVRVEWTANTDQSAAPGSMRVLHDNIAKALRTFDQEVAAAVKQSVTTAFDLLRAGAKDLDPSSRLAWKLQVEAYLRGNGVEL
jgi:hypothetical protein